MKYFAPTRISENIHKTPEGYLLCIGVSIGRTGSMTYGRNETPLDVDPFTGTVEISREADELFKPETIASFEGKSFTIKHPKEFVGPDTWKDLTVGVMKNVRRGKGDQSEDLVCDLLITDAKAIDLVESGEMREVSCGYECGYVETGEYKGKQIEIIGNHLALVDAGRAGPSYAINDHEATDQEKGPIDMSKKREEEKKGLVDRVKALFGKAQDEAMKEIDNAFKTTDADESEKDKKPAKDEDGGEAMTLDGLGKMMKDAFEEIKGMVANKPAKDENTEIAKKQPKAEDEDESEAKDEGGDIEARLKALEEKVSMILEAESAEANAMTGDEDGEEEEVEDDDIEEETVLTGDAKDEAARIEILAPGLKGGKDAKKRALVAAYATKDGKTAITMVNGGRKPTFDSAEEVNRLFIASSEFLKQTRSGDLASARKVRFADSGANRKGFMTPEEMNKKNAEHYGKFKN